MYLCIAPLSRFYYPETRRFINAFYYIIIITSYMDLKKNKANEKNAPGPFIHCRGKTPDTNRLNACGVCM